MYLIAVKYLIIILREIVSHVKYVNSKSRVYEFLSKAKRDTANRDKNVYRKSVVKNPEKNAIV